MEVNHIFFSYHNIGYNIINFFYIIFAATIVLLDQILELLNNVWILLL